MGRFMGILCSLLIVFMCTQQCIGWGDDNKVRLEDVKVLTLHDGRMTNARRSSAVPQLKCIGGSAQGRYTPQTVQCINMGSDGYDVQWECKADMDNSYRFGKLQVSCEGYESPNDPFILKGSCGLEYMLELTEEGYEKQKSGGYQNNQGYHSNQNGDGYQQTYSKKSSSVMQDLIYLGIFAGIIYIIYKTCIATTPVMTDAPPPYDDTRRHGNGPPPTAPPPPYGFNPNYMPNDGGSCASGASYTAPPPTAPPGPQTGGGFWSGAATGGIMGYLFGSSGRTRQGYGYQRPHTGWGNQGGWGSGWGSGWGGGSRTYTNTSHSSGFSSAPRSSGSSGTRTASGFAGTTRR